MPALQRSGLVGPSASVNRGCRSRCDTTMSRSRRGRSMPLNGSTAPESEARCSGGTTSSQNGIPLDPTLIGELQREHAADADVLVGLQDRLEMLLVERIDRAEVLHRRHAAAQAFERAEQGARADLGGAALGIARRQRAQHPQFERDGLEAALEQNVMRMIVRVDEARHHQLFGCIDRLVDRARAKLGDNLPSRRRLARCRDERLRSRRRRSGDRQSGAGRHCRPDRRRGRCE